MSEDSKSIPVDAIQFIGDNLDCINNFVKVRTNLYPDKNTVIIYHNSNVFGVKVGEWIVKLHNEEMFVCGHYLFRDMFATQIETYKHQVEMDRKLAGLLYHKQGVLIYVAGPYSGTPNQIISNIARAEKISINLIRNGFNVYTPHKNCSGYEVYEDDDITVSTWYTMGLDILSRCDAIYVMSGSEDSSGTIAEVEFAQGNGVTVLREDDFTSDDLTLQDYLYTRYMPGEQYVRKQVPGMDR